MDNGGFVIVLIIVLAVIGYVVAKVRFYMRKSEAEWRAVDKSKLREWVDEED